MPRYGSFLGGSGDDAGTGIAVNGAGNAYVIGTSDSTALTNAAAADGDFPTTPGALQRRSEGGTYSALGARLVIPAAPLPALDPVSPPAGHPAHTRYFPATHHVLRDPFLKFWDRYGNGPLFGSPISEVFTENEQRVQYFERARRGTGTGHGRQLATTGGPAARPKEGLARGGTRPSGHR